MVHFTKQVTFRGKFQQHVPQKKSVIHRFYENSFILAVNDQKLKGNICSQIEFLCVFSPLCTFYFYGGLGLGVALIRIIANTL